MIYRRKLVLTTYQYGSWSRAYIYEGRTPRYPSVVSYVGGSIAAIYQVRFRPEMKPGPMIRMMSMRSSSIAQQFSHL